MKQELIRSIRRKQKVNAPSTIFCFCCRGISAMMRAEVRESDTILPNIVFPNTVLLNTEFFQIQSFLRAVESSGKGKEGKQR